jgi:hypothetical protein
MVDCRVAVFLGKYGGVQGCTELWSEGWTVGLQCS